MRNLVNIGRNIGSAQRITFVVSKYFWSQAFLKMKIKRKRAMLREVELARGRLRLGVVDDDMQPSKTPNAEDESKEVI